MSEYTPTTEAIIFAYTENKYAAQGIDYGAAEEAVAREEVMTWLDAHDAEVRDGVVAEEPGWEYGTEYDIDANESVFTATHSEEMARKWVAESPHDTGLVRRRKAGPWVPVDN